MYVNNLKKQRVHLIYFLAEVLISIKSVFKVFMCYFLSNFAFDNKKCYDIIGGGFNTFHHGIVKKLTNNKTYKGERDFHRLGIPLFLNCLQKKSVTL